MDTNLIFNCNTSQTTSVDRYAPIYAMGASMFATGSGSGQSVMSCAGTLKNLYISHDTAAGTGNSRTWTVYKNGADTGLTVTIADPATSGNDTVNTVSVVAGDTVSLHQTANTTTTGTGTIRATLMFSAAANTSAVFANTNNNLSNSVTSYLPLQGQGNDTTAGGNVEGVIPTGGTIRNAYGVLGGTPGSGKSYTFTLVVNGVDSALTFSVSGTGTTGNDTANSVSVSAGDRVYWKIVPSGTPSARAPTIGAEFDPTTNGESIHTYGTANVNVNTAARYMTLASSTRSYSSSESSTQAISQACTWKNLYVYQQTALAGSQQYLYQFSDNGSAGSPSVTITNSSQSGNDTSNTATSTVGETVAMKITPTSTPATTITEWGIVSYIAPASTARTRTLAVMGVG